MNLTENQKKLQDLLVEIAAQSGKKQQVVLREMIADLMWAGHALNLRVSEAYSDAFDIWDGNEDWLADRDADDGN